MTAGAHPFRGPTAAATFDAPLNREPPAPVISNPEISPELERIISRALEKIASYAIKPPLICARN